MLNRTTEWEEAVVVAMLRLKRAAERERGVISNSNTEYSAAHRHFHCTLISGCGFQRLRDIHATVYDQFLRYRYGMLAGGLDGTEVITEHQKLVDFALGEDIPAALTVLENHLNLPVDTIFPADQSPDQGRA
jgi:DNA-binding GntR family transcriptional regulator